MKKKIISIMIAFAMLCALVPCIAMAEDVASGECGTDATWTLDDSGTLTISGTGAAEISSDYKQDIKKLVVENGITEIIDFQDCTALEEVILPEGITKIGDEAFYGCTALKKIKMPLSANSIGWSAFYNCTSLESVSIPYGVEKIETETFYNCTSLKSVRIPSSVSVIDQYAFCGCSALESISLPEGVRKIECNAFEHCETLKSVYIPNSIKYIYDHAFYNCYDLTDVYYNGTEKEWETLCMYKDIDDAGNMMLRYADMHYVPKPMINGTPTITAEGNTYTATIPLKNVAVDCQLIAVLYKDGIVKAVESKSIPLNAESESISVSADEADEIKLFIWDSLSGAVPMCGGYSEAILKE